MLESYIVESADDNKNGAGQSNTNTTAVFRSKPVIMPEPRPALPIGSHEPDNIGKSELLSMPVPPPTGATALPAMDTSLVTASVNEGVYS